VTVIESATAAARVLADAGFPLDESQRDVSVLARHLLGWSLTDWAVRNRDDAPAEFAARLDAAVRRRATHEPVAYITGVREFYGREFHVTPAALIPRPETEALVEVALHAATNARTQSALTLIDVGTGSGCLAVTVKLERPSTRVIATDISAAALDVARRNAARLGADVEFVETSLLPPHIQADVIVSNPPYIPEHDRATLPADVREFEPAAALFAGPDGLDVIRELVPAAHAALRPGGRLVMEIGAGQADDVAALLKAAGFEGAYIKADLQGIPRVVVARRLATAPQTAP
jgi:release factor glutamine methyltransferase